MYAEHFQCLKPTWYVSCSRSTHVARAADCQIINFRVCEPTSTVYNYSEGLLNIGFVTDNMDTGPGFSILFRSSTSIYYSIVGFFSIWSWTLCGYTSEFISFVRYAISRSLARKRMRDGRITRRLYQYWRIIQEFTSYIIG